MEFRDGRMRPTYDRAVTGSIVLAELEQGRKLVDICRDMGIGRATIWRWAKEDPDRFGGLLVRSNRLAMRQRLGPTPSETECAYAAGLIDGEGCITIARGGTARLTGRRGYSARLIIAMTNRDVIEWMHRRWRGMMPDSVVKVKHYRPQWTWTLSGDFAAKAVHDVLPFLIVKRAQASLLLDFQRFTRDGVTTRSDEDYARIEAMYAEMKALNRRGVAVAQE